MVPEGLPERVRRTLGREGLRGAEPFDPRNAAHVDLAAHGLLRRALLDGDANALGVLVDLCQPKLELAAEQVASELGLGMPADELIVALFSTLFVADPPQIPDTRHFLAWATDWMRRHAEAWIRDLALLDTPPPGAPILPPQPQPDGSEVRTPNETVADYHSHLVKVCFHRLEVDSRRLLRACDVQGLSVAQAASQLGLDVQNARIQLERARVHLTEAIAKLMRGPRP